MKNSKNKYKKQQTKNSESSNEPNQNSPYNNNNQNYDSSPQSSYTKDQFSISNAKAIRLFQLNLIKGRNRSLIFLSLILILSLVYLGCEIFYLAERYINPVELIVTVCSIASFALTSFIEFNIVFFFIQKWIKWCVLATVITSLVQCGATYFQSQFIYRADPEFFTEKSVLDLIIPICLSGILLILSSIKSSIVWKKLIFTDFSSKNNKKISQIQQAILNKQTFDSSLLTSLKPQDEDSSSEEQNSFDESVIRQYDQDEEKQQDIENKNQKNQQNYRSNIDSSFSEEQPKL